MSRDYERYRQFSRRAFLLGAGQGALITALLGRLYYLQFIEGEKYTTLAEDNRINVRLVIPPRGEIRDRYGKLMAGNRRDFRLSFIPEQADNAKNVIDNLAAVFKLNDEEYQRINKEMKKKRSFIPVMVRDNLTWDEVAMMELNNPDFPGAHIEAGQTRHYPYGEATAHVLGYVAPVSESELQKAQENETDPMMQLPDFRIGKKGIEKTYDLEMRGMAGASQFEVNAYGRVIRELATEKGKPGRGLLTTLDIDVQRLAMERLKGQSGSVIALDAFTGEVYVLASAPGFDPNSFNNGISTKYWEELLNNQRVPLTNKAIAGQYAPGSTFKVVTALAALEHGVYTPSHSVYCPGYYQLGNNRFHCWKREGHGTLGMVSAITESCDVYFYEIAQKLGVDRIADVAMRLGLGEVVGVDIPGEKKGLIPTRRWKEKALKSNWQLGESLIAAIGQGYVLATPIQLAVMAAHLVNGGYKITPRIVMPDESGNGEKPPLGESIKISDRNLKIILAGMEGVTTGATGTARGAQIHEEGLEMAGKTGTSQVRRITMAERATGVRKNEDLPWLQRDHALFMGYAPIGSPKFVCSVVVEHGGGGSAVAAPIARDVLYALQKRAQDPNYEIKLGNSKEA